MEVENSQRSGLETAVYCLGFIFTPDRTRVLLMLKNRPDWQRGKLNGLGGKVSTTEVAAAAMARECREECGLHSLFWHFYGTLSGRGFIVHCFCAISHTPEAIEQKESEPVDWYGVEALPENVLPNCRWLIPMALSFDRGERAQHFSVIES